MHEEKHLLRDHIGENNDAHPKFHTASMFLESYQECRTPISFCLYIIIIHYKGSPRKTTSFLDLMGKNVLLARTHILCAGKILKIKNLHSPSLL